MTIKQFIKKYGVDIDCALMPHRWGEMIVFFDNTRDDREDSTSFDIEHPLTADGANELSELYSDFCKEENIAANTVSGISLNCVAESYDELVMLC